MYLIVKNILLFVISFSSFYCPTNYYNPDSNGNMIASPIIDKSLNAQQIINNLKDVPQGTKILSFNIEDDIAFIDLSNDFNGPSGMANMQTVFSIVDTFCSAPGIHRVKITVEGLGLYGPRSYPKYKIPIKPEA